MTATGSTRFGQQPGKGGRAVLWIAGIGSVLPGCLAILFPIAATLGADLTFGALLIAVGGRRAVCGLMLRRSARMLWSLLSVSFAGAEMRFLAAGNEDAARVWLAAAD